MLFIVVFVKRVKFLFEKFNIFLRVGKINVVIILNKKIIDIVWVILLLCVFIIGVVVVMVEFLYIEELIFISIIILVGILISFVKI